MALTRVNKSMILDKNVNIVKDNSSIFEETVGSWATYADAAGLQPVDGTGGSPNITAIRTTTGSEVLNGLASLKISKDAANRQGEGVSLDITVPNFIKGQPCKVRFAVKGSSNFDFGTAFDSSDPSDITVYLYDVTNSKLLQPYPYTIISNGFYEGMFQIPSDCSSLRLILHITTTNASAYDLFIDDVEITQAADNDIKADSDWESYTPTFTGFGTVSTSNFQFKKNGDSVEIKGTFTAGTTTATEARVSLPAGLLSKAITNIQSCGSWFRDSSTTAHGGSVLIESGVSYVTFGHPGTFGNSTIVPTTKDLGNSVLASSTGMTFTAKIPIQGWTSGNVTAASANLSAPAIFFGTQTSQAVTANTTDISFTASTDTLTAWSTNIYTVKVPGDYNLSFSCISNSAGASRIYKNGSFYAWGTSQASTNAGTATMLLPGLKVGDTISVRYNQNATITEGSLSIFKVELSGRVYATRTAYIKDVKTSATSGGSFTSGAYQTRTLNTLSGDTSFVSLSSNQFTLQPGTYKISASAPGRLVNRHKVKLRNVTDSTDPIIGESMEAVAGDNATTRSSIEDIISITSAKTFELQHRCETTAATTGFGLAAGFGDSEVYAVVKIEKVL